ncbi:uncharacterized protein PGTG_03928 [Puccinia graminis f. sp. tritici CRL 75-36-700-3]|uniref:Uncharacterized protein n=1 Tax=Puccinia graminis f. sp. tritici (strain CRL 75-36-700-3 / race SCCL) TaxID=418459 RepID=E3K0Z7_PUCGT|nr:uncharacterized protein PGTG_03928 [Puccinia graminis f. sp. tritici CRL 75-36-700-3]EFP77972.2 hypothetical protein PGTG_03928 [Puccinia graminis f. sp. tritici CRL 75-36-700-3]
MKPNRTSDLAIALEPFGYGRDRLTGQRSTTLRQLPDILTKFQNSRDTVYFTKDGLKQIMDYAASNPEQVVENDFLNGLLQTAKQYNANPSHQEPSERNSQSPSPDHRIRTTESPSSSNGDRRGVYYGSNSSSPAPSVSGEQQDQLSELNQADNSFDSNQEHTIIAHEHPPSTSSSQLSPPKLIRKPPPPERHRSVPIGFGDTYLKRPRPPSRRSKVSSVDLPSTYSTPSKFAQHRPTSSTLRTQSSPGAEAELDSSQDPNSNQSPELQLGTPFSARNPQSQSLHSSAAHLTPNNLSTVIFNNRQRGLYDSSEDSLEAEAPPDSNESAPDPTDIIRRIRTDPSSRPNSKVYTRVWESGIGLDGYPTPPAELHTMMNAEDLVRSCEDLKTKNKELVNQIVALEKIHEDEIVRLTDEVDELKQELSSCKKSEKELANVSSTLRYQLTNSDDQMSRLNSNMSLLEDNYHKIKLNWEEAVAESEKLRRQLNLKEEALRCANRSIQSHASEVKKVRIYYFNPTIN